MTSWNFFARAIWTKISRISKTGAGNEDTRQSEEKTLTDCLQLDRDEGLPDVVGDPAVVVPELVAVELLDDQGAPQDLALLALNDRYIPCLAASPQLLPLKIFLMKYFC